MSSYNHANMHLPVPVDRALRTLPVTPDMHRVHHSMEDDEANSNFGFNLSLRDRLFGTYRAEPHRGRLGMTIGIHHYRRSTDVSWLPGLLTLPLKAHLGGYAINGRRWHAGEV